MTEEEGVLERGRRLLKEEAGKPEDLTALKKQVEESLQKVEMETKDKRQSFEALLATIQKTAQVDLENAQLEKDILLLVKQYFERKTRIE